MGKFKKKTEGEVGLIYETGTGTFKKGCPLLLGLSTPRSNCYIMAGRGEKSLAKREYPRQEMVSGAEGLLGALVDSNLRDSPPLPLMLFVCSNSWLGFFFSFSLWLVVLCSSQPVTCVQDPQDLYFYPGVGDTGFRVPTSDIEPRFLSGTLKIPHSLTGRWRLL